MSILKSLIYEQFYINMWLIYQSTSAAARKDGGSMRKSLPLEQLDGVIDGIVSHIHDYTKSPKDFTRDRKLNAGTLIRTTLDMQGNSLNAELYDAFPDIDKRMTASAYEQAKDKLLPKAFEDIFHGYNKTMENLKTLDIVDSYRVYAADGCKFNVPYQKDSIYAVDNGDAKPYAMLNANMLFDLMNRTYQDCILQTIAESDERKAATEMIKRLDASSPYIVIMDRGYASFNMFETLNRILNCHYIIRMKASEIREIRELPDEECDKEITFRITTSNHYYTQNHKADPYLHLIHHPKKHYKKVLSKNTKDQIWDFEQFCKVKVRIVKFRINDPDTGKEQWEVLATNLNRFEFHIERMKEMYHMRWDIETSFRELKYTLGAVNFHSKKPEFIQMELYSHFIMFNAVSRHISSLNVPQTNHKHKYAIDFKMACKIVRRYYRMFCDDPPENIYLDMLSYINPVRPGRKDKRNMKAKSVVWFVYRVA